MYRVGGHVASYEARVVEAMLPRVNVASWVVGS